LSCSAGVGDKQECRCAGTRVVCQWQAGADCTVADASACAEGIGDNPAFLAAS